MLPQHCTALYSSLFPTTFLPATHRRQNSTLPTHEVKSNSIGIESPKSSQPVRPPWHLLLARPCFGSRLHSHRPPPGPPRLCFPQSPEPDCQNHLRHPPLPRSQLSTPPAGEICCLLVLVRPSVCLVCCDVANSLCSEVIHGTVNDPAPVPPPSPSHGHYHWTFDRAIAAGLVPLSVAPFAAGSLNPTLDALLCGTLLVHSHLGIQQVIIDYVPTNRYGGLRKFCMWALNGATILAGIGLYEFETTDVGVVEATKRLWKA